MTSSSEAIAPGLAGWAGAAERAIVAACALGVLAVYSLVLLSHLPVAGTRVGADYGLFFAHLMAGLHWAQENGFWTVPWFTPAFCGGIPFFANMQGLYFSLPQALTFAVSPLTVVQSTVVAFAAIGMGGCYQLLRGPFRIGMWAALAGATIFVFNGFFTARMLSGHFSFHAFMLVTVLAAGVLVRQREDRPPLIDPGVAVAGLALAYMVYSGMVHALLPVLFGVVAVILIHGLTGGAVMRPLVRLAVAGSLGAAIAAAKIVSGMAFIGQFPRDMLPLAGYGNPIEAVVIGLLGLMGIPPIELSFQWLQNKTWYSDWVIYLGRHELDYGLTIVPFVLMGLGLWVALVRRRAARAAGTSRRCQQGRSMMIAALVTLCAVPLLLNWYAADWNAVLKSLPLIRNSSLMIRWMCLYILPVVVVAALVLDRSAPAGRLKIVASLGVVLAVVGLNVMADRSAFVRQASYDVRPAQSAWVRWNAGAATARIDRITWLPMRTAADRMRYRNRNDAMFRGASEAQCYEPMFGHKLEAFPFQSLRPGPALEARNGVLNVKNPACMLYPGANSCKPGDHFKTSERAAAQAFLSYRPFPFVLPWWQKAANVVSVVALFGTLALLVFFAGRGVRRRFRVPRPAAA